MYSQTCLVWLFNGGKKWGHMRQKVAEYRFNLHKYYGTCIRIWKLWSLNTGNPDIEVVTKTGLTVAWTVWWDEKCWREISIQSPTSFRTSTPGGGSRFRQQRSQTVSSLKIFCSPLFGQSNSINYWNLKFGMGWVLIKNSCIGAISVRLCYQ